MQGEFIQFQAHNGNSLFCGLPKSEGNLGGNIYQGDFATFSPSIIKHVLKRFAIKSVLDVGSGQGHLPWLIHNEYHIPVMGIEGLPSNIESAIYPLIYWDLNQGPFESSPVDLVTCVEVAEHIAEDKVDNLLDTLCLGRIILMTHTQPNKNGAYHLNEKSDKYWITKLTERGYCLLPNDTYLVRNLDTKEPHGAYHYSNSALVFARIPEEYKSQA